MSGFESAVERYAEVGVDVESAMAKLAEIPISLHCWQGDDVGGFEAAGSELGGGLAVTGNYLGKARTPEELRQDMEAALSLLPGKHRLNLHAMYGEFGGQNIDRVQIEPKHFEPWIEWCASQGLGFDFNPTCFNHPKASDGFTLAHRDAGVREFWIEHCRRCREIGDNAGKKLGSKTVTNIWVPDGFKDTPADRLGPRERLRESLDAVFATPLEHNLDSVESKLFGIGSESYVAGSHEFYLGYAIANRTLYCLDAGHYHPTESIADKITSCLVWLDEILLHVSRGVRWDSDHVVTLTDDLLAIAREIVANGFLDRVHIGLDFFDASINRVAAWVIGTRSMRKALLIAMLEPSERIRADEGSGDYTSRLFRQENLRALPWGEVWAEVCRRSDIPEGEDALQVIKDYENRVLSHRR
ncbi:MAG TPA: L-rhamnose isomerase [Fimbriimonadaceae bacterium]|nr:L-rhamnose isomerase [Fimbriimonadaceae bacterium]